jgi:hypothetical protein
MPYPTAPQKPESGQQAGGLFRQSLSK